jgi:hypothetical protein
MGSGGRRTIPLEERIAAAEASHQGLALQVDDLAARLHKLMTELKMEVFTMDYGSIGWSVSHLRKGWKVRRKGWPSGVWIAYLPEDTLQVPAKLAEEVPGEGVKVRAMLLLRDTGGAFTPFVANQNDLMATDWELVDPPLPGHTKATTTMGQNQNQAAGPPTS